MNNRGAFNLFSIFGVALILVLVVSGVGYLIGNGLGAYGQTFNTTIGGVDITSPEFAGIEYFVNGTQNANSSVNVTNVTQTESGGISFIQSLQGTRLLLSDMVQLTPLGGTAFGSLIDELILAFFAGMILILTLQFFLGRTLTS
jgi:hypothetical protein